MFGSFLVLATAVCAVAAQLYASDYGGYSTPGTSYAPTDGRNTPSTPGENYTQVSGSYPSSKGSYSPTSYPPSRGPYPPINYTPASGSYPPTGYTPSSESYPPTSYTPSSGSYPSTGYTPPSDYYPTPGTNNPSPIYQPSYQPTSYSSRDLKRELADARTRILNLGRINRLRFINLDSLRSKIDLASNFTKELQNKLYPDILADLKVRDDRIAYLRDQLKSFSNLSTVVAELLIKAEKCKETLKRIRDNRIALYSNLFRLQNEGNDQELDITVAEAQIATGDKLLNEVREHRARNDATIQELIHYVRIVVDKINQGDAQSYTVVLTPQNPVVNVTYTTPFRVTPSLTYCFTGFDYDYVPEGYNAEYGKGYDKGNPRQDSLYPRLKVTGDAYGFTASAVDNSSGYEFKSLTGRITSFAVDNTITTYEYNLSNNPILIG